MNQENFQCTLDDNGDQDHQRETNTCNTKSLETKVRFLKSLQINISRLLVGRIPDEQIKEPESGRRLKILGHEYKTCTTGRIANTLRLPNLHCA